MDYTEIMKQIAEYSKQADTVSIIKLLHDIREQGYQEGYKDCNAAYELIIDYKFWI